MANQDYVSKENLTEYNDKLKNKIAEKFVPKTDIVDNVTTTATGKVLDARQGKVLNDRIDNVTIKGRFLSGWNSNEGRPQDQPPGDLPYVYQSGDYYTVTKIQEGGPNYRPDGSEYDGTASTKVESEDVVLNDVYKYTGSGWILIPQAERIISFASVVGEPRDNTALATEFDKQIHLLGKEPGSGQEYHFPFNINPLTATSDKISTTFDTITLDNNKTKVTYSMYLHQADIENDKAGLYTKAIDDTNVKKSGTNELTGAYELKEASTVQFEGSNPKYVYKSDDGTTVDVALPKTAGTVALTSDIKADEWTVHKDADGKLKTDIGGHYYSETVQYLSSSVSFGSDESTWKNFGEMPSLFIPGEKVYIKLVGHWYQELTKNLTLTADADGKFPFTEFYLEMIGGKKLTVQLSHNNANPKIISIWSNVGEEHRATTFDITIKSRKTELEQIVPQVVPVDNTTLSLDDKSKIAVKDSSLTTAKFSTDAISTVIAKSDEAVDTKFTTEKAVRTVVDGIPIVSPNEETVEGATSIKGLKINDTNYNFAGGSGGDSFISLDVTLDGATGLISGTVTQAQYDALKAGGKGVSANIMVDGALYSIATGGIYYITDDNIIYVLLTYDIEDDVAHTARISIMQDLSIRGDIGSKIGHAIETSTIPYAEAEEIKGITIDNKEYNFPTGGSGSASWGSISGTLSDQTDLMDELNLKADTEYVDGALELKQDKCSTEQELALDSGITADLVSKYEGYETAINNRAMESDLNAHVADMEAHVTASEKEVWNNKASPAELLAHTDNMDIHVTLDDKSTWDAKQNALSETQMAACDSGINTDRVSAYDGYANSKANVVNFGTDVPTEGSTCDLFIRDSSILYQKQGEGWVKVIDIQTLIDDTAHSDTTTWSSNELKSKFEALSGGAKVEIVATKPETGVLNTIYYVGTTSPYHIWLYANNSSGTATWFDMGSTAIDLSGYYTKTEIDTKIGNVYTKTQVDGNFLKLSGGTLTGPVYTSAVDMFRCSANDSKVLMCGGKEWKYGGGLEMYGTANTDALKGGFHLYATNSGGSSLKSLKGYQSGKLTWCNKDVLVAGDATKVEGLADTQSGATEIKALDIGGTKYNLAGGVTGINMNGSSVEVIGGVADLGTVITSLEDYYTKTEIDDSYLKLSGGTMSGAILVSGDLNFVKHTVNDSYVNICGGTTWNNGAMLQLSGKEDNTIGNGCFQLNAMTSTEDRKKLVGKPDGTLTWNEKNILCEGDVYTKTEVDDTFARLDNVYSRTESDTKFASLDNVYVKTEVDSAFARIDNVYDRATMDTSLANKQNKVLYGTADPSGGEDGDIYIKYTA